MGMYWLHKCRDPLTYALGEKFKLYAGYETRSSRHGGFTGIYGIVMHHDADPTGGSDDAVIHYEYVNATDKPIGNFHVQRDGDVWFGAAGASNHAGKGGPVPTSRGTIPLNLGNYYLIGIEASNNGVGEVWNATQMESYLTLVTVLCNVFQLDPMQDVYGHWTWCEPSCPGRKIDPRGPTPSYPKFGGTSGTNKWNMNEVRREISARIHNKPIPPQPSPIPPNPAVQASQLQGDSMAVIVSKEQNSQTIWYSVNGGFNRLALRNMEQAGCLRDLVDAKTKGNISNVNAASVLSTADLDRIMGPRVA